MSETAGQTLIQEASFDPALSEHLQVLRDIAGEIGADGVFVLRGIAAATLAYVPKQPGVAVDYALSLHLHIAPGHPTLFLAIFKTRDGREVGVES